MTPDNTTPEEWRPVPRTGGAYSASTLGRIKSHRLPGRLYAGRVLKQSNVSGYRVVTIQCWASKLQKVHRLVLFAHVGPCPHGSECRHLDGDRANNRLDNLRWGTKRENAADTRRLCRDYGPRGEMNGHAVMTWPQVIDVLCTRHTESGKACAQRYSVSPMTISRIRAGKTWRLG